MAASFDWNLTTTIVEQRYAQHLQGPDPTIMTQALDDACADVNRAFLGGGMEPSQLVTDDLASGARIVCELTVVYYHQRATGNLSKAQEQMRRWADSQVEKIRKDANSWVAYSRETGIGTMTTMLDTGTNVDLDYIDNLPMPGDGVWGGW